MCSQICWFGLVFTCIELNCCINIDSVWQLFVPSKSQNVNLENVSTFSWRTNYSNLHPRPTLLLQNVMFLLWHVSSSLWISNHRISPFLLMQGIVYVLFISSWYLVLITYWTCLPGVSYYQDTYVIYTHLSMV